MYSHVRHRSLDETYINQLLNLFSTAFSSNSLKGDALAALRLAYPVASLRKCLPSGQRLFKACSGPSALAQLGFAPLEPPLLPPRARGAGGRAPPAPTHGGWGHSVCVKGPSPRPSGCGPHQPLDPHSIRSGRGSRFAQRPRSGPDLDALERPQRSRLVVRGAFPLTACHVANGQAPLGGRVSGGSKAKPRRLLPP